MATTPEQRRVLRAYKRAVKDTRATRKPAKALTEAGLVESNLRNLSYGDLDSTGSLQQRASSGYKHAQDPYLAAVDFLKQAIPIKGKYGTAGQLAQAVQRSAYPGRYDQRSGEANALLRGTQVSAPGVSATATTPSAYGNDKRQIALSLLGFGGLAGAYGAAPPQTRSPSSSPRVRPTQTGSPIAGEKAHAADHPTAGLPGYPAHDYMAPAGTTVVAPVSGKIIKLSGHDPSAGPTSGPHGPFGWSVYVQGDDGKTYFLTHLGSRNVKVGQRVRQGARIGTVGDYAKYGGADHVHEGVHG